MRSPLLAHAFELVRGGMLPRDAACEAWNDAGLHGSNRDRFIEEVELAAAAGGLATSTTGGNDGD